MRCPVCKAENSQGPACRRCKADVSLLYALDERRDGLLAAARLALSDGRWHDALAQVERAWRLRRGADAGRLLAVAHLLGRDFRQAWRWYQISSRESAVA